IAACHLNKPLRGQRLLLALPARGVEANLHCRFATKSMLLDSGLISKKPEKQCSSGHSRPEQFQTALFVPICDISRSI
ncbi:hypothetical protein G3A39_44915, partial [Paraburkholderia aspalathi]|nr:hypothetical protein [Paraburkholderia aspalathi]